VCMSGSVCAGCEGDDVGQGDGELGEEWEWVVGMCGGVCFSTLI